MDKKTETLIEAVKCCGNCKTYDLNNHDLKNAPCFECKRTSTFKTGQQPTIDKWEMYDV